MVHHVFNFDAGKYPRIYTKEEMEIILNQVGIAVVQDSIEQGRKVKVDAGCEIWKKNLKTIK